MCATLFTQPVKFSVRHDYENSFSNQEVYRIVIYDEIRLLYGEFVSLYICLMHTYGMAQVTELRR